MRPRPLRSALRIATISMLLVMAGARLAQARTYRLSPDGLGDVATFQTGIDTLLSRLGLSEIDPDTLRVEPGEYAEDVELRYSEKYVMRTAVVLCPAGPTQTRLRSIRPFEDYVPGGSLSLTIVGLAMTRHLSVSASIAWRSCAFPAGFDCYAHSGQPIHFDDCTFRDTVSIITDSLQHCRFSASPQVYVGNSSSLPSRLYVIDCAFSGIDEVFVFPTDGVSCVFQHCTFDSMKTGLHCDWLGDGFLRVEHCRFSNIVGEAIRHVDPPRQNLEHLMTLEDSRIERCGGGVYFRNLNRSAVYAVRDTFVDISGDAMRIVTGGRIALADVLATGGTGDGIVALCSDPPFSSGDTPQIEFAGCTLAGFAGHGIVIGDTAQVEPRVFHRVDSCLVDRNRAGGILALTPSLYVRSTLIRGNGGDGLEWDLTGQPDGAGLPLQR